MTSAAKPDLHRDRDLPAPYGPDVLVFGPWYAPPCPGSRPPGWVPRSCPCGVTWKGAADNSCWACGDAP